MTIDRGRGETPFRINFECSMPQDNETLRANIAANTYPKIAREEPHGRPLAIVGGGPGLRDEIDALRGWQGDIWAINRTGDYLADHGIASTLVSVDASGAADEFCKPVNADGAIFASWCAPDVLKRYHPVRIFDMFPAVDGGIVGSTTTAGTMAAVALRLGYTDVTWFGCEGSFSGQNHVGVEVAYDAQLIIRAASADYRTVPGFLLQCEELANIIRAFPKVFSERSGGLLRALLADPDWCVVAVSESLKDHLEEMNGAFGLYEKPYDWKDS